MSKRLHHSPRGGAGLLLATLAFAPLISSCGGDGNTMPMWPKGNVVFMDANNYTSDTSLTIPTVQTAPGADLMICWDQLSKDLLCHDIAAPSNGVDNVAFVQIKGLTHAAVADQLAVGQFDENLATTYGDYYTSQSPSSKCTMLSTLKLGNSINPAEDYVVPMPNQTITYMLLFATGTTPAVGTKSMLFLEPTAGSTVTKVDAIDACSSSVLHFQATLGQPMTIDATDSSKWHVDWSQLTEDSFGNPIKFTKIDKVLIGFYQGKTAADLQANFKDIEQIATKLYEVSVAPGARDVKLGDAKERGAGTAFPGFTQTDGVWAMAVQCSKCQVPAPVLLSILQPQ